MTVQFRWYAKILGLTFAILWLAILTVLIPLEKWFKIFAPKTTFYSVFHNGTGLSPGVSISLKELSLDIGKVSQVTLNEDNTFLVEYEINTQYANRIGQDSLAILGLPALDFLPASIQITLGKDNPLPEGSFIPSILSEEGQALAKTNRYTGETPQPVETILENIASLTAQLNDPDGPILGMVRNLEGITRQFAEGQGIGQIYNHPGMYNELFGKLQAVHGTLTEVKKMSFQFRDLTDDMDVFLEKVSWDVKKIVVGSTQQVHQIIQGLTRQILFNIDGLSLTVTTLIRNLSLNLDPFLKQVLNTVIIQINGLIVQVKNVVKKTASDVSNNTRNISSMLVGTAQKISATLINVRQILMNINAQLGELDTPSILFPKSTIPETKYIQRDTRMDLGPLNPNPE